MDSPRQNSQDQEREPLNEAASTSSSSDGQIKIKSARDAPFKPIRSPFAWRALAERIPDVGLTLASTYFISFAWLVFVHRGQHVDEAWSASLLKAARYGPTIFPILYAAITANFLKSVAAIRLEKGTTVLTMEYLLQSRTVFSSIMTCYSLKSLHTLAPLLVLLWALSPLGGQAALRVISVETFFDVAQNNISYLAYVSPVSNGGVGSASANFLGPVNAAFTSSLAATPKSKVAPQDLWGNVKVPMLESFQEQGLQPDQDGWYDISEPDENTWSSLTGLPTSGVPHNGNTDWDLNSAYMVARCNLTGLPTNCTWMSCLYMDYAKNRSIGQTSTRFGWSGANYNFTWTGAAYPWVDFEFHSVVNEFPSNMTSCYGEGCTLPPLPTKVLTKAQCLVTMSFVESKVRCRGQTCGAVAVRRSSDPKHHSVFNVTDANRKYELNKTVLTGLGASDPYPGVFWYSLAVATNPEVACDTVHCQTSAIEGYLADPLGVTPPVVFGNPMLWQVEDKAFSRRMTQLINTYWINDIGVYAVSGQFNTTPDGQLMGQSYNIDSDMGTHSVAYEAIVCDYLWFAILLSTSTVMLTTSIASMVLSMTRRGPDILENFSTLLKDNKYVDLPVGPSMEDGVDRSKRLRDLQVCLGDVHPNEDVGYAGLAVVERSSGVQRLRPGRQYA